MKQKLRTKTIFASQTHNEVSLSSHLTMIYNISLEFFLDVYLTYQAQKERKKPFGVFCHYLQIVMNLSIEGFSTTSC